MGSEEIKDGNPTLKHIPVLRQEILDHAPLHTQKILDCTLGGGGHSLALLNQFEQAQLIASDRDSIALETAKATLSNFLPQLQLHHARFSTLEKILATYQWKFDYIIADIGVSSFQFDQSERGFSFTHDGPLDMRMDANSNERTAADWINDASEQELVAIFRKYGEERFSQKIGQGIVKEREKKTFHSTQKFAKYVASLVPRRFHKKGIHPATLVFQALRIAVNDELQELQTLLQTAIHYLNPNGRLALISFHSLEDRLVKHQFQEWENPCHCPQGLPFCICGLSPLGKRVEKRPIRPSAQEIKQNSRSRSAKLRVFERC